MSSVISEIPVIDASADVSSLRPPALWKMPLYTGSIEALEETG